MASKRASTWAMKRLSFWEPEGRGWVREIGRRGVVVGGWGEVTEAIEAGGERRGGRKPPALGSGLVIIGGILRRGLCGEEVVGKC